MRWSKRRRACLLLALMVTLPGALADEPAVVESAAATAQQIANTPMTTAASGSALAAETSSPVDANPGATVEAPAPVEETPEATAEAPAPAEETPEASAPATQAPAEPPETTTDPSASPEASLAPTDEPTAQPSPEPSATPSASALSLVAEGATQDGEETWQFALTPDANEICFSWSAAEGATAYACEILDAQGNAIHSIQTAQCRLSLPARDYAADRYILRIRAMAEDAILAEDSLAFRLAPSGQPGGGRPSGGFGGGRPSGGSASGDAPEAEQGFRVTPGEALTTSHASGTKDMRIYGTVALEPVEAPVAQLTLGDAELSVRLDGGESTFTAALEGETLVLTPETGGTVWTVNARALEILNRSGAAALTLRLDGEAILLPTDFKFQGAAYAALRSRGYVSGDFNLCIDRDGLRVEVDGQSFLINDNGELIAP